ACAVAVALAALSVSSCGETKDNPVVVLETSKGTIKIELFPDKAPITVKNFLKYVDDKHYDGTLFHRVIEDFMIQGGGFGTDRKEKPTGSPITNESNNRVSSVGGTVAMAGTDGPDTATAQFFINGADNPRLDGGSDRPGYAAFGKVVEGMDVVDKIRSVPTGESALELLVNGQYRKL